MKAINLHHTNSSPAPLEWADISEIKEHKPRLLGCEISLQKVDGHNICVWMIGLGGVWTPASDLFYVKRR